MAVGKKRNPAYDIVLSGGWVIGRANSAYDTCDVAVEDGKIRKMGLLLVPGIQQNSGNAGGHLSLPSMIPVYPHQFQSANECFGLPVDLVRVDSGLAQFIDQGGLLSW
jgi:predicted amidohydrolase